MSHGPCWGNSVPKTVEQLCFELSNHGLTTAENENAAQIWEKNDDGDDYDYVCSLILLDNKETETTTKWLTLTE